MSCTAGPRCWPRLDCWWSLSVRTLHMGKRVRQQNRTRKGWRSRCAQTVGARCCHSSHLSPLELHSSSLSSGVYEGNMMTAVGFDSGVLLIMLLLAQQQLLSNRELAILNADLRKSSALFESLVVGSSDLITCTKPDGRLRYAVLRSFGYSICLRRGDWQAAVIRYPSGRSRQTPSGVQTTSCCTWSHRTTRYPGGPQGSAHSDDASDATEPPSWRWVEAVAHNMLDDPSVKGIVCNTRDIQEQQLLRQRQLRAYHDTLTGLGNLALARRIFAEQCFGPERGAGHAVPTRRPRWIQDHQRHIWSRIRR